MFIYKDLSVAPVDIEIIMCINDCGDKKKKDIVIKQLRKFYPML